MIISIKNCDCGCHKDEKIMHFMPCCTICPKCHKKMVVIGNGENQYGKEADDLIQSHIDNCPIDDSKDGKKKYNTFRRLVKE